MELVALKEKYTALFKRLLAIFIGVAALFLCVCATFLLLFMFRKLSMPLGILINGSVTAAFGVFALWFCTYRLLPSYRVSRVYKDAERGLREQHSFTVEQIVGEETRQGVDYVVVVGMERRLLFVSGEPTPEVGERVQATMLGNTVVVWKYID